MTRSHQRVECFRRLDSALGDRLEEGEAGLFVWMLGAGRVHGNVGVDQDHGINSLGADTDCRTISSGVSTGRLMLARSRTAASRSSGEASPYSRSHAVRTSSPRLNPRCDANSVNRSCRFGGKSFCVQPAHWGKMVVGSLVTLSITEA